MMEGFDWGALFFLAPTVVSTSVIVRMLVEFCNRVGWVKDGEALLWSSGINAVIYVLLFFSGYLGYGTEVEKYITLINSNLEVFGVALALLAMVLTSTGGSKLFHEILKKVSPWWDKLDVKG